MGEHGGFGFDPDEFDRMIREGSEGLRDVFERVSRFVAAPGARSGWSTIFEDLSRRPRPAPETAGEAGDGVWAIYTVDDGGGAHVERSMRPNSTRCARTRTTSTRNAKSVFCPMGSRSASSTTTPKTLCSSRFRLSPGRRRSSRQSC